MDRIIYNNKLSGNIKGITSKSYGHRAIFCAALASGSSRLKITDLSEDIKSSLRAVQAIGVDIDKDGDMYHITPPVKFKTPVTINVKESGTTLRLLIPVIAALGLKARIIRTGSLVSRTNSVYFDLLPQYGINIEEKGDSIYLSGQFDGREIDLAGNISSQFISGFLIASGVLPELTINLTTELESKPYVDMTIDIMDLFGINVTKKERTYFSKGKYYGTSYNVEKDWSNGLFFLAAGVEVTGLNKYSKQGDKKALEFLKTLGYENISNDEYQLKKIGKEDTHRILDAKHIPDTVPIMCIMAGLSKTETKVINIERLRLKESDRITSTIEMLTRLGVSVTEEEDCFYFTGIDRYLSATIDPYNDHRIAMSAAIASLYCDDHIKILDSNCVEKSYTEFFKDFKSLGGIINEL